MSCVNKHSCAAGASTHAPKHVLAGVVEERKRMSACAVCNETLDAPVLKTKRKRLYGTTCRAARQILEKVLLESTGGEGVTFSGFVCGH